MGDRFQVPTPHASEGRTDGATSTPFRERTRSEDIEIARKYKEEDPIAWAGTRAQRLQQEQQAVEREKEAEARKLAYAEHVEETRVRMEREEKESRARAQAEEDALAQASRSREDDRIEKAFQREQARRRAANLPLLPPPIRS